MRGDGRGHSIPASRGRLLRHGSEYVTLPHAKRTARWLSLTVIR